MRICIINEFFYPDSTGGTGAILSSLARALHDNYTDMEIDVITSRHLYRESCDSLPETENWEGISITRLNTPYPRQKNVLKRLYANVAYTFVALLNLLRRNRYDYILVGTAPPPAPLAAKIYKVLKGVPYVYVVYDLEPDRSVLMKVLSANGKAAGIFRRRQRRWLHAAAKTVVLGRCMRDYLVNTYDLPSEKIRVIPIGYDPENVFPLTDSHFRAEHHLDGFVALYSGNFGRYHNFDTVLDAAKQLAKKRDDITFVLVGGGAQKEHIEQRITDEKIANVLMFPFVPKDQFGDLLASANVSLVTLEPGMEGLCVPSKFYSILASGRPTVAMVSPVSEIARVLQEAECGVQISQGDAARLVEVITDLANSPLRVEEMGRNARREFLDKYTTNHIADLYHSIFASLAGSVSKASNERIKNKSAIRK